MSACKQSPSEGELMAWNWREPGGISHSPSPSPLSVILSPSFLFVLLVMVVVDGGNNRNCIEAVSFLMRGERLPGPRHQKDWEGGRPRRPGENFSWEESVVRTAVQNVLSCFPSFFGPISKFKSTAHQTFIIHFYINSSRCWTSDVFEGLLIFSSLRRELNFFWHMVAMVCLKYIFDWSRVESTNFHRFYSAD